MAGHKPCKAPQKNRDLRPRLRTIPPMPPPDETITWETDDAGMPPVAEAEPETDAKAGPEPDIAPAAAETGTAADIEASTDAPAEPAAPVDPDEVELSDAELAAIALPEDFGARIEAVLLTAGQPMTAGRIARSLDLRGVGRLVRQEIRALNDLYAGTKRSFRIEEIAGTYQVMTLPVYAQVLGALRKTRITNKVSKGALEALAIVAYRQPIVRADIDAIRGVSSGEVLKTLMDHHLIKQVGRAQTLGRPVLYGTTRRFLEVFGLGDLKDLPKDGSLRPSAL